MSEDKIWEASCVCGELKVRMRGDPQFVSSCACKACQRRTGSFFGVTAFFSEDQIDHADEGGVFDRMAESGNRLSQHFCGTCGSTVWWKPHARPGVVAVAGGSFADPTFPAPRRMVWAEERHPWICTPEGLTLWPQNAAS